MTDPGGRSRRTILLVVVLTALAAAACGNGSGGAENADGELDPTEWVAADVGSVPEGLVLDRVEEYSSDGRRISYRAADRGPYGDTGWQVQVTARVPLAWSVDEMLAAFEESPEGEAVGEIETEVNGHRAVVMPATDDGREHGWEVLWEESPGVQVHLVDSRHDPTMQQTATRDSALELAADVQGMDRTEWDAALRAHEAADQYAGPADGAVEREVADGVLDARQWTLSVLEAPDVGTVAQDCFRLSYAGEDTGPGCSVQRVVLGGKGFVIIPLGKLDDTPELEASVGSSFDPIQPAVHQFGTDPLWHVAIAVLPDGACGVEYQRPLSAPGDTATPLNLLPGDPGAVECADR